MMIPDSGLLFWATLWTGPSIRWKNHANNFDPRQFSFLWCVIRFYYIIYTICIAVP